MTSSKALTWVAFLCTLLFSAFVYEMIPGSNKDGLWQHNVLRNWKEYGFFRLGGKLVQNPGGHDAIDNPEIYTGHRAASLYVPYLMVFVAGETRRGELLFYLLLVVLTLGTAWRFLGRTPLGLSVGCAAVLSPGFARCSTNLDPLTIPVLFGLPVMSWVCECLEFPKLRTGQIAVLVVIIILYSQLNWTVVFSVAVAGAYLLATSGAPRRNVFVFFLILAGAVTSTVIVSISSKLTSAAGATASKAWNALYNAYLLGPGGYMGYPMNWPKAITRLAAASLIGLFPLLLLFSWIVWQAHRALRSFTWKTLSPLLAAMLSIATMRNYFAQHPWMASSVLILGIIFSVRPLVAGINGKQFDLRPASASAFRFLRPIMAIACGLYCCLIVLILRANSAQEDALRTLIQQNTRRHDVVLVSSQFDSTLAENLDRLSQLFDRKVALIERLPLASQSLEGRRVLLSANSKPVDSPPIAQTRAAGFVAQDILHAALEWYRRNIAHRSKGDRLQTEDVYFLLPFSDKVQAR